MAGNKSSQGGVLQPHLNFKDHCLLCLQPQEPDTIQEILRKNPKKLKSFQPVIHYLTGADPGDDTEGKVPLGDLEKSPPLCWTCYDITAELYRLHEQLLETMKLIQKQTEVARRVVTKTLLPNPPQPSPRTQFFTRIRTRGMPEEDVEAVTKFVKSLHEKVFTGITEKKNVRLPTSIRPVTTPTSRIKFSGPSQQKPPLFSQRFTGASASATSIDVNVSRPVTVHPPISKPTPVPIEVVDISSSDSEEEEPDSSPPSTPAPFSPSSSTGLIHPPSSLLGSSQIIILSPPEDSSDVKYEDEDESMEEVDPIKEENDEDIKSEGESESGRSESEYSSSDDNAEDSDTKPAFEPDPELMPMPKPDPDRTISTVISSILKGSHSRAQKYPHLPPLPKKRRGRPKKPVPVGPVKLTEFELSRTKKQTCDLCWERVPLAEMLMFQHMSSHVQDYLTKCRNPACPMVFSCRRKMERHIRTGPTTCRQALGLHKHMFSYTKTCETCNFSTKSQTAGSFLRHLQSHEYSLPEKNFPCPIPGCSERFALRQSVDEHLFTHDLRPKKTGQNCPLCKELFNVEEIAHHLKSAHQVEEVIPCQRCPFQFHSRELLLDHLSEHAAIGLTCDLCEDKNIKFVRYESLRQHYFNVHRIGNQFICEHCDRIFFVHSSLTRHLRTNHSSPTEGRKRTRGKIQFKCDLCPYVIANWDRLRLHKFSEHGVGDDPLLCRHCSQPFPNFSSLKKHEAAHFGLGKTYKCHVPDCGKEFPKLFDFTQHKLVHSNSRSFLCDLCPHRSNHARALKHHKFNVHKQRWRKPSMCDVCGESFCTPRTLNRHKLIHTGERPYSCHICGQRFRERGSMKIHVRSNEERGADFKPKGAWQKLRKRVVMVRKKNRAEAEAD